MSETRSSVDRGRDGDGPSTPAGPVGRVAFWAAVGLPFAQLSLLVAGIEGWAGVLALLVLVVGNVLALVAGHRHRQRQRR